MIKLKIKFFHDPEKFPLHRHVDWCRWKCKFVLGISYETTTKKFFDLLDIFLLQIDQFTLIEFRDLQFIRQAENV